jgi:hypothetical protein
MAAWPRHWVDGLAAAGDIAREADAFAAAVAAAAEAGGLRGA